MRVLVKKDAFPYAALVLCAALAGCRHQPQAPPLAPQARTPDIFVAPPSPKDLPPMTSAPPTEVTEAKPAIAAEEVKPKRKRKTPPATASMTTPPAATPAPAAVPAPDTQPTEAPATLGALAPESGTNPKEQQEVAAKIAAVEKRVSDLPASIVDKEQKQIAKVRLFLKEASDALKGGDVEGAKILATKADLLVDDLQK